MRSIQTTQDASRTLAPSETLNLQRAIGNLGVMQLVQSQTPAQAPLQTEFNRLSTGESINEQKGRELLARLAHKDETALREIEGAEAVKGLGEYEWGLGRKNDGTYRLIKGKNQDVSWTRPKPGLTNIIIPVAHSHPHEKREVTDGYSLNKVMNPSVTGDVAGTQRNLLFPSLDDVTTASAFTDSQAHHTVYTPYFVTAHHQDWLISNKPTGDDSAPLSLRFEVLGQRLPANKNTSGAWFEVRLTAWAGTQALLPVVTAWADRFGGGKKVIRFEHPPVALEGEDTEEPKKGKKVPD